MKLSQIYTIFATELPSLLLKNGTICYVNYLVNITFSKIFYFFFEFYFIYVSVG
jgi:hypothetical protein